MVIGSLISVLMASRTQAHIFHLQTTSFSAHKALQEYYEGIVELIDNLAESYQGRYEVITGYSAHGKFVEQPSLQMTIFYFQNLVDMVILSGKEIPQDTFLLNQIDEIVAFINSTIYKLKVLQ